MIKTLNFRILNFGIGVQKVFWAGDGTVSSNDFFCYWVLSPKDQNPGTVPKNLNQSIGTQNLWSKLGIWLSQKFLSLDCPSDICPSPKRLKRISPKSRNLCPGTKI